jgi:glycosyltransferase involved in cell wall biosynthesis
VGGVETHLNDLVEELSKRGNKVFVLTYRPLSYRTEWKIFEEKNDVSILRLPWFTGLFYKLVTNPILEFLYLLPGLFVTTPFVLIFFNPKVVHTHGLVAGFVGVFWGKVFGKRVITTTHSIYNFPGGGAYRNFAKWVFNKSNRVLTLSKQSKNEIEKLGVESGKISVFTYWIDLNKFKPVKNAKGRLMWKDKFVVLFVGRLVEEKGVLVLLEAAKGWDENITLAIIGTGPLEAEVKHYSSTIKHITYLGKVDNSELPLYYSAADLLIVPSTSEEGFGRVILESLACGTPVVGSNRGAIPEAIDESVGRLINISSKNINEVVEYYFKHRRMLLLKASNAREFSLKRYSINNIRKILSVYE